MTIQVFATGGTFDKEYDFIHGRLYFRHTHLPEMFKRSRSTLDLRLDTLMMVDSLDMTEDDRKIILQACQNAEADRIIITHGTDTMVATAAYLAQDSRDKTIVLTGAMIPYKFGSSDGFFNLGGALAFVQTLPPGVYIVMNGRFFDWDKVRKNVQTGFFEEI